MIDTDTDAPDGMQTVNCQLCGHLLGYQPADTNIDWSVWVHSRCPERLARAFGLTRDQIEELTVDIQESILASFPDLATVADIRGRNLRSRITAEYVLERFLQQGWKVVEVPVPSNMIWQCVCAGQGGSMYRAMCPIHDPSVDTTNAGWRKWYDDHLSTQRQLKERLGWG